MSLEQLLRGHPAAPGIAVGPALRYRLSAALPHGRRLRAAEPLVGRSVSPAWSEAEVRRLDLALDAAEQAMDEAEMQLRTMGKSAAAQIFNAHRMLLRDAALYERAVGLVLELGLKAEEAIGEAGAEQVEQWTTLANPYLLSRAVDIREVVEQVQRILLGDPTLERQVTQPAIIVAYDLAPVEMMHLPREYLLGFVLAAGGHTAHSTILARALGIPAVTGLGMEVLQHLADGVLLVLDGEAGHVTVAPTQETLETMQARAAAHALYQAELRDQRSLASVTRDGHPVTLLANVSSPAQAEMARELGAAGVGSLRTEILFIAHAALPDEDEQVALYHAVTSQLPGLPVVVRTLDLGGDKQLPAFPLPEEDNPFLGWRGIRIGLSRPDELLLPQLRAMLRAGALADLRIVVPMIATLSEFRQVRALVQQAHAALQAEGVACTSQPQLGVLIEVPAAALIADELAREADFISIGTNDLVQYTLACDRTSPRVAGLYQPLEPAILRLIASVVEAAHHHNRCVSVCGEMASDAGVTALLLGLGVDELSCAPAALPRIRAAIRSTDMAVARRLAREACSAATLADVQALFH